MRVATAPGISRHGGQPEVVWPIAFEIERRVVARG